MEYQKQHNVVWNEFRHLIYEVLYLTVPTPNSPESQTAPHPQCTQAHSCRLSHKASYHFHVEQIKRSEGRTAVASAAYRAGEKLHNLWDGETHDYTRKGGVVLKEIFLPEHAPERFSDRYTLWNEVEQVEKRADAQLAYSFDIALQNEFSMDENNYFGERIYSEIFCL